MSAHHAASSSTPRPPPRPLGTPAAPLHLRGYGHAENMTGTPQRRLPSSSLRLLDASPARKAFTPNHATQPHDENFFGRGIVNRSPIRMRTTTMVMPALTTPCFVTARRPFYAPPTRASVPAPPPPPSENADILHAELLHQVSSPDESPLPTRRTSAYLSKSNDESLTTATSSHEAATLYKKWDTAAPVCKNEHFPSSCETTTDRTNTTAPSSVRSRLVNTGIRNHAEKSAKDVKYCDAATVTESTWGANEVGPLSPQCPPPQTPGRSLAKCIDTDAPSLHSIAVQTGDDDSKNITEEAALPPLDMTANSCPTFPSIPPEQEVQKLYNKIAALLENYDKRYALSQDERATLQQSTAEIESARTLLSQMNIECPPEATLTQMIDELRRLNHSQQQEMWELFLGAPGRVLRTTTPAKNTGDVIAKTFNNEINTLRQSLGSTSLPPYDRHTQFEHWKDTVKKIIEGYDNLTRKLLESFHSQLTNKNPGLRFRGEKSCNRDSCGSKTPGHTPRHKTKACNDNNALHARSKASSAGSPAGTPLLHTGGPHY